MFIGPRIFLLILFLGWQAKPMQPLKGNPTKAFQDYFSGVNHFKEGNIPLANQYFKSAFDHIPTNFTFCLSFALTQGKLNKLKKAEDLLRHSNSLVRGTDAEIQEKKHCLVSLKE